MQSFVQVKDLTIQTFLGAGANGRNERATPQNIGVSIKAYFNAEAGCHSDQLQDTIDYGLLADIASAVAREKPRYLMEHLAFDIASQLFATSNRITQAEITLEKYRVSDATHTYVFSGIFTP